MDHIDQQGALLPADLMAEVEAAAAAEHRPAREMVREAVELYLQYRHSRADGVRRGPQEAAMRMLERRKLHPLPEGMSIRDLITHGRA